MPLKSELEENPYAPPLDEDYLASALEYRDRFEDDEDFQEALAVWPRCPRCGRRRVTRCPVCKTSGTLFPLGDADFWDFRSEEEKADDARLYEETPEARRACSCGSGARDSDARDADVGRLGKRDPSSATFDESEPGPSTLDGQLFPGVPDRRRRCACGGKTSDVFDDLPEKRRRRRAWAAVGRKRSTCGDGDGGGCSRAGCSRGGDERNGGDRSCSCGERRDGSNRPKADDRPNDVPDSDVALAVCYVCSEAFVPKFPRVCEWCDYVFEDGEDPDADSSADAETAADVAAFVERKKSEDPFANDRPNEARVVGTVIALGVGLLALLGYLAFVAR